MNFKLKQRKKSTHATFQNILKVALFELKKRMGHLFLKKRNINSLVLSLCFSESYLQPDGMSEPENTAIFVNLNLIKNSKKEVAIRNKIKRVDIDKNFDILNEIYDTSLIDIESIKVKVSSSIDLKEEASIDITEKLSLTNELMKVKVISFEIKKKQSQEVENVTPQRSMNVLMRQSHPLETLKGYDKKVSLHNDLIRDMQENNLLCGNTSQEEGHKLFKTLSNPLWYLDGQSKTIQDASKERKNVTAIPE